MARRPDVQEARELLSVQEAADRLSVSRSTLYRMLRDGILGSARHGSGNGRIVIPQAEIEYYIQSLHDEAKRATVAC